MRLESVRVVALSLIVLTVSVVGWSYVGPSKNVVCTTSSDAGSALDGGPKFASNQSHLAKALGEHHSSLSPLVPDSKLPPPIIPFITEYCYGTRYFVEKIRADQRYIGIEATLHDGPPPIYEVLMTENEGHRKVYYTNSQARAEFLQGRGKTTHITQIEYELKQSLGEDPVHIIRFKDEKGIMIQWKFVQASEFVPDTKGVSLVARPLKVLYRGMASMAGEGTGVQIGNVTDKAPERPDLSTPPDLIVYEGTLCAEPVIGGLVSGSQTWLVKAAPRAIEPGAEWLLVNEYGAKRRLGVIAKNEKQVTIRELDVNAAMSAPLTLNMRQTANGLSLSSLVYSDAGRVLRVTFVPDLDIGAVMESGKSANLEFHLDIGDQPRAITGTIQVQRILDHIEITAQPSSPNWAKGSVLKSRVTLTSGGYSVQSETSTLN